MVQIENYNKPFLDALAQYDDGRDLSDYDFNEDELVSPHDDANKRKLAYRHRVIAQKYLQVKLLSQLLVFLYSTFGSQYYSMEFYLLLCHLLFYLSHMVLCMFDFS